MREINITKRKSNEMIIALNKNIDFKVKTLFTIRAEKLAKPLSEIATQINYDIKDKESEFAMTDKNGILLHEEVVITDSQGNSRKENSGVYKYTNERRISKDKALQELWDEEVSIPVNVIKFETKNYPLYKGMIEKYSASFLTLFSGILLDIPLDNDGFADEEWILKFLSEYNSNGIGQKEEASLKSE